MSASTSYLRAPLRTSWIVASTTRRHSASGSRACVSTCFFSTSPSPPRRAGWVPARGISTDSFKPGTDHYAKHTQLAFVLGLSTSVALGMFLYWRRQSSVRRIWAQDSAPAAVDPTPAPTSEKPVPPYEFAEKPFPVVTPEPMSTRRSISFVPAQAGETAHSRPEIYEIPEGESSEISKFPKEEAILTSAPHVPPSITRDYSVLLQVPLTATTKVVQLTSPYKYEQWTFNDTVPGPFIRARVGDVVELALTNRDRTGNPHNVDCHAFTGPGGGAALTTAEENETKTARFKLLYPGLFLYHCAAAPVPVHIANGMYGLIYVQPTEGDLPSVDREYYVMQSEFYHEPPEELEDGRRSSMVEFSYPNALREEPDVVVFNGSESALTRDRPLKAHTDETIRIYFGNAGPNLTSSFHVLGSNFRNVYRDGDVVNPPASSIQTVSVPPGAATIVNMKMVVPGTYTLIDHAIFRLDKGAVGYLNVSGKPRPDIYQSAEPPAPCVGCKLHP